MKLFSTNPKKRRFRSKKALRQTGRTHRPAATLRSVERLEDRRILAVVLADFNGDGHADLATGIPGEEINGVEDAGAVSVIYGSEHGLDASAASGVRGDQRFHQGTLEGNPEAGDRFGEALAKGYFNEDTYLDLAIGVPGESISGIQNAGAVQIVYGGPNGLTTSNQLWHQDSPGLFGIAEAYDEFGSVLTVGNFDGDAYDDLAIGVPGENLGDVSNAGVVHILYGSPDGLQAQRNQLWSQDTPGMHDSSEHYDDFGAALAAGDFDGDGAQDLAIGVPGEDHEYYRNNKYDVGMVAVIYGQHNIGLSVDHTYTFDQRSADMPNSAEAWDYFGAALAAGNFNGRGPDDLAIGIPGEEVGDNSATDAGAVTVLYGSDPSGLTGRDAEFYRQGKNGLGSSFTGTPHTHDLFGASLAAADLDNDGGDELVVGVPGERGSNGKKEVGAVQAIFSNGGDRTYHLDMPDTGTTAEDEDHYGTSVAVFSETANSPGMIAVAAPGFDPPGCCATNMIDTGMVHVMAGDVARFDAISHQLVHQDVAHVNGQPDFGDQFGGKMNHILLTAIPRRRDPLPQREQHVWHWGSRALEDYTVAGLPQLQSKPGAPVNLYLDFDGIYLFPGSNLRPNMNRDERRIFNIDKSTTSRPLVGQEVSFNRTEREVIQDVWMHVAEDFAPFDVNVTTVIPRNVDFEDLHRISIGGNHPSRTGDMFSPYYVANGACGIDRYNGRLRDARHTQLVYAENILGASPDYRTLAARIGTAASHEAGHGYGTTHVSDFDKLGRVINVRGRDNQPPEGEYSPGWDGWSPIMGRNEKEWDDRTIWTQRRLAIPEGVQRDVKGKPVHSIREQHGNNSVDVLECKLNYSADDHSFRNARATQMRDLSRGQVSVATGSIYTTGDRDNFKVHVRERGLLRVVLSVNDVGANLDARLGIDNAVDDPQSFANSLGGLWLGWVDPGDHFIRVASEGYFDGDIGQYTVRASLVTDPADIAGILAATAEEATVVENDAATDASIAEPQPVVIDMNRLAEGNNRADDTIVVYENQGQIEIQINQQPDPHFTGPLDQIASLTIIGSADHDSIRTNLTPPADWLRVDGRGGSDALRLLVDTVNIWSIDHDNGGIVQVDGIGNRVAFESIENLKGGRAMDWFILSDGVQVAGTIDAGGGGDRLDYSSYRTDVNVDLQSGSATNIGHIARFTHVTGGRGDDHLFGNDDDNRLRGNAGADVLRGRDGRDTLYGGAHDDTLYGGAHRDRLYGQRGNDSLYGGSHSDRLYGGKGDDLLHPGTDCSVDVLWGQRGADTFVRTSAMDHSMGMNPCAMDPNLFHPDDVDDWRRGAVPIDDREGFDPTLHLDDIFKDLRPAEGDREEDRSDDGQIDWEYVESLDESDFAGSWLP